MMEFEYESECCRIPTIFCKSVIQYIFGLILRCIQIQLSFWKAFLHHLWQSAVSHAKVNRHRASTSMYSLTFCVHFLLPERHQRKPAVQTAAVMLRTSPHWRPIASKPATPTSHIRRAILRMPPVICQSAASSARRPCPAGRSHLCHHIAGWTQACN